MLSYPFLLKLYQQIASRSRALQGRIYMAPFQGNELNSINLEQLIADSVHGEIPKQYPLSLVLGPVTTSQLGGKSQDWEDYTINQLFLKQQGMDQKGHTQNPDSMGRSQHSIVYDWHDMRRVAIAFTKMLHMISTGDMDNGFSSESMVTARRFFRLSQRVPVRIVPVTQFANDKLNGVLVTYGISLYEGCDVSEDYPEHPFGIAGDASSWLSLPVNDQHPEHLL